MASAIRLSNLFKAIIFAVKQPPILDRVIYPFSQGIM